VARSEEQAEREDRGGDEQRPGRHDVALMHALHQRGAEIDGVNREKDQQQVRRDLPCL